MYIVGINSLSFEIRGTH